MTFPVLVTSPEGKRVSSLLTGGYLLPMFIFAHNKYSNTFSMGSIIERIEGQCSIETFRDTLIKCIEIKESQNKLETTPPTALKEKEMQFWKNMINETMLQRGLVNPQTAKYVTDNMSIKRGIDPNVVNGLRESVKTIHSDAKIIEKANDISNLIGTVDKTLSSGSVEHIVVTTPNGVFKLIDERGQIGIMFIKPDYETLMKNYGVKQTRHRLNELKF